MHIELLLEEPSAEAFFRELMPKILPPQTTWTAIVFQGKADLLKNLEARLKGYRSWIPSDYRIAVLIDEDRENCQELKARLEEAARSAGLSTKTQPEGGQFTVLNRIAVEELEAWLVGDPQAVHAAYPRVSKHFGGNRTFRNPDQVAGGTWEAVQRLLQKAGYYSGGLPKIEFARSVGKQMEPSRNVSPSFNCFIQGLNDLLTTTD